MQYLLTETEYQQLHTNGVNERANQEKALEERARQYKIKIGEIIVDFLRQAGPHAYEQWGESTVKKIRDIRI